LNGLDPSEQAKITPILEAANNWIIFTHPLVPNKATTPTPPILKGAQRILYTKGKAGRERGWWRTGTDKLASHGLDTEVWISLNSTISNSKILAQEALLQTKSQKDPPDMRSEGVEPIYWAGMESGLMDIYNFPGVIYATDSLKGSTGIGAGFYRHDIKGCGCCRVGGGAGGGSSGRAEFAAACLALEDSLTHDQPIVVLTDSKGLMTVASNWVGKGKDPLLRHSPDGDILAHIIKVLHQKVGLGLFTMFIKIRAHRGEFKDGQTKVERTSTMCEGMVLAHILPSCGLRRNSIIDAPCIRPFGPECISRCPTCNSLSTGTILQNFLIEKIILEIF